MVGREVNVFKRDAVLYMLSLQVIRHFKIVTIKAENVSFMQFFFQ